MNLKDLTAQAKALAPVIRDFVSKSVATLRDEFTKTLKQRDEEWMAKFREIEQQQDGVTADDIAAKAAELIPAPRDGKDADPEAIKQMVEEAVALIPAPRDGSNGSDGKDGQPGEKGSPGQEGKDGKDGKDAEPVDVEAIIAQLKGYIDDKFAALPVPADGKDGTSITIDDVQPLLSELVNSAVTEIPAPTNGVDGKDGKDGSDGKSVEPEYARSMLEELIEQRMADIEMPQDGAPGRDAIDIDILPSIDPEKSYTRGTYATYDGGLWRAHATTDGMRGWECVVDGIKSIDINRNDDRSFGVMVKQSSGESHLSTFTLPIVIDKGVYKQADRYHAGDGVTWAGSYWIAQKDEPSQKPGEGEGWRLAVKKGRDGKHGDKGDKGDQGQPGSAGRDLTQMGPNGSKW